jgi:hypothetical protein
MMKLHLVNAMAIAGREGPCHLPAPKMGAGKDGG